MTDEASHRGVEGEFNPEELAAEAAIELPTREALSIVDPTRLSGGIVSTGQTTPDPTQMTGQPMADPAQANQPAADASDLGNETMSGATQSATASPSSTYQPSATSNAQS
jgi:hypothetical protein